MRLLAEHTGLAVELAYLTEDGRAGRAWSHQLTWYETPCAPGDDEALDSIQQDVPG